MTVSSKTALSPRRRAYDRSLRTLLYVCAGITVALLVFLIGYIFYRGLSNISWSLLTSETSYISDTIGILPNFLNTLYIILLAMVIVLPLGVGAAIYLTEYATNRKVVAIIEFATETLTGIPSIISVSETALRAVPEDYEQASLALGATHLETVFRVTVPAARSGVATAIVLGVGRAIGEAMAIIMVAGNVANMPGLFQSVRFLTTAIASEMSYASVGSLQRNALFSIGLVLFLFIMLINVFLNVCIKRKKEA